MSVSANGKTVNHSDDEFQGSNHQSEESLTKGISANGWDGRAHIAPGGSGDEGAGAEGLGIIIWR